MKRIKELKYLCLISFVVLLFQPATSQEISKTEKIEVQGTVVAIDLLASSESLTAALQHEIVVVHVRKLLEGKEDSYYIKVVYQYYPKPSPLLDDLLKGGNHQWKFNLTRDPTCDNTVEELSLSKSYQIGSAGNLDESLTKILEKTVDESGGNIEGIKDGQRIIRLKDTGGLADVPRSQKLPCYILKSNGFRRSGKSARK